MISELEESVVFLDEKSLLEYKKGQMGVGMKYVQRLGTPGNYIYVYPGMKKFSNMSRKTQMFFNRHMRRARGFLSRFSLNYDAQNMNIKPKTWNSAVLNIKTSGGELYQFHVNLKSHGIYSYRSRRGMSGGTSASLARSKKKGILRYR